MMMRSFALAVIFAAAITGSGCANANIRVWAVNSTAEPFHIGEPPAIQPGERRLVASGTAFEDLYSKQDFTGDFTLKRNGNSIGEVSFVCGPVSDKSVSYDVDFTFTQTAGQLSAQMTCSSSDPDVSYSLTLP
jgi:hypothetical protein